MMRILRALFRRRGSRPRHVDLDAARRGVEAQRAKYGGYEALGQDIVGPH